MSAAPTTTAFGRIFPPRDEWLAKAPPEPIIDPDLPIIDTHHHLWQRTGRRRRGESWEVPAFRYLLHEFLADCATGHNIIGSVFLQCHSMYRAAGPVPDAPRRRDRVRRRHRRHERQRRLRQDQSLRPVSSAMPT